MLTSLKTVFGIDLRTLALFRIYLGIAIIADVVNRWPYLRVFYTDDGIFPRAAALDFNSPVRFSIFLMSGLPWFVQLLFGIMVGVALCLILGYRTRLMTFLSWVLFVSLVNRNLILAQGGDTLLTVLLFWALFLPLGARFSVDDAMRKAHQATQMDASPRGHAYFSVATLAILLQVSYVYFFGALLKTGPDWTQDFTAIYYALSHQGVTSALGEILREYTGLLGPMTRFVYWLEFLMPFYIFTPFFFLPFRLVGLAFLVAMHIGFAVFLNVGLFPLISILSLSLFVPGAVWDWFDQRRSKSAISAWALFYDRDCSFCRKTCLILRSFCLRYETRILPAQSDPVAAPLLEEHTSWVVRSPSGEHHLKWEAVLLVIRQNPFTLPLAWLLGLLPAGTGQAIYDKIGNSRSGLGQITSALLPYRDHWFGLNGPAKTLVGILLALVLAWNVQGLPDSGLQLPDAVRRTAYFLQIRQKWAMFAPGPSKLEGWYAMEGTLSDGSYVDLWTGKHGRPPIAAPEDVKDWFEDYRWRKYFDRLRKRRFRRQRQLLANYWCKESWENANGDEISLSRVKMTFYSRRTQPPGQPDTFKTYRIYNKACK